MGFVTIEDPIYDMRRSVIIRQLLIALVRVLSGADDKPMTFSGNSYVRWRLTVPLEKRLNLWLELRTVQPTARLMHAAGHVDYSILEVT